MYFKIKGWDVGWSIKWYDFWCGGASIGGGVAWDGEAVPKIRVSWEIQIFIFYFIV